MNENNFIKKEKNYKIMVKKFGHILSVSVNGMSIGLFGTSIIAAIVLAFARIPGANDVFTTWGNVLNSIMGAGIGLGIALALKKNIYEAVGAAGCGMIGNYAFDFTKMKMETFSDPLSSFAATLIGLGIAFLIMRRKTPLDILLVPLIEILGAIFYSFLLAHYVHYIALSLSWFISKSSEFSPILMCMTISLVVSFCVVAPISSVAICIAVGIAAIKTNINGEYLSIASGAALIGCSTGMVGIAIESIYDNKPLKCLALAIGTPKLQFANIMRKPQIWLPTLICSFLLGPLAITFKITTDNIAAGMGTCGLIGLLDTYLDMLPLTILDIFSIPLCTIVIPLVSVFVVDLVFRLLHIIKKGDFKLSDI